MNTSDLVGDANFLKVFLEIYLNFTVIFFNCLFIVYDFILFSQHLPI